MNNNDFIIASNRKDANANSKKILSAAMEIFATKGMDTTIEEVAKAAEVGIGTVYRRFKDKEQLAKAVANEAISDIYSEQEIIIRENIRADEKLKKLFACYAKLSIKYGKIHPIIIDFLVQEQGKEEFSQVFLTSLHNIFVYVIEQGQEEGIFNAGDPRSYHIYLENLVSPVVVMKLAEVMPLKDTADFIADLALNGLYTKK